MKNSKSKKVLAGGAVLLGLLMTITPAYAKGYQLSDKTTENGKTTWEFEGDPVVLPVDMDGTVDASKIDSQKLAASWKSRGSHDDSDNEDSSDEDTSNDSDSNTSDSHDITLSGDEEVPAVDSDGEGNANVRLLKDEGLVCVDVEVSGITLPATDAHIHKAVKGQSGPVALALPLPNEDGDAYGCVKADSGLITDLMDHPENYYVNVHSKEHPNGELRGQLSNSE